MLKALKIAAGSGIAIVAAEFLQLSYATSAGIITLLTVQDTRQDTIQLTVDRILSFLLCVGLIYVCFHFPPAEPIRIQRRPSVTSLISTPSV